VNNTPWARRVEEVPHRIRRDQREEDGWQAPRK
jgi:hypothetical protein